MTPPTYKVAYLNAAAKNVLEIMQRVAPAGFDVQCAQGTSQAELQAVAHDADFLIAGPLPVDRQLLEAAPKVRLIQKFGIGVDKIDLEAARALNIPVAIATGSNARPVAEMAVLLMLATGRNLPMVDRRVRAGDWPKAEMRARNHSLNGKTLGLFGFGNIGRNVAKLLAGFDVEILYHDHMQADVETESRLRARYASFEQLLRRSDIVSLHAPLTDKTRKIIDARTLSWMKPGSVLINTARGELIDEAALLDALATGHLRGAGLDTLAEEPPPPDHPLFAMEQVVISPHIGGAVIDNVENVARHAFDNMSRILAGEPIRAVDLIR